MSNIITVNANDVLENFQNAYYNQIGSRMQIGSEEYTLSSIFTYVLSVYSALINQSYKNQNLDTASGEYLDAIASKYGLSRSPDTYSNPWFEGRFWFDSECEYYNRWYDKGDLKLTIANHVYTNSIPFTAANNALIKFVCTEPHGDELSHVEFLNELKSLKDSNDVTVFRPNYITAEIVSGLNSLTIELNDTDFRQYIKDARYLHTPGIASAFEAIAKTATDHHILDARVRVQGDQGFRVGYVDLFCKPFSYPTDNGSFRAIIEELDIPYIAEIISDMNISVIGQQVNVMAARRQSVNRQYTFMAPKAYQSDDYTELYELKYKASVGYLNTHKLKINAPFIPTELTLIMSQPLSNLISDPSEIGYLYGTDTHDYFNEYKDLPVIGLSNISDYDILPSAPDMYYYLLDSTRPVIQYV